MIFQVNRAYFTANIAYCSYWSKNARRLTSFSYCDMQRVKISRTLEIVSIIFDDVIALERTWCDSQAWGRWQNSLPARTENLLIWRPDRVSVEGNQNQNMHTWRFTGDQSMKFTNFRSLIRCNALWTCVGSTSPWTIFRTDMNLPFKYPQYGGSSLNDISSTCSPLLECCDENIMFFVCSNRLMTSKTVVLRILHCSLVILIPQIVQFVLPVMISAC